MKTNYADPSSTTRTVSARISPVGGLDVLSRDEVARLRDASGGPACTAAPLRAGGADLGQRSATTRARCCEQYPDFDIQVLQQDRGIKIELTNAPAQAFVDGQIIRGINELLFAVVRDIVYVSTQMEQIGYRPGRLGRASPSAVFEILRNARILQAAGRPEPGGVLGRPLDLARRVRLHQAGRLRARPARAGHLHRLRPGRDEGADEGRDHRARQAAAPAQPLHRHHRAGHHRGRVAEPDRQPPGDHAGHREAPRGVRAPRPRHHRVPRRRRHGRGNPLPARHPAAPGQRRHAVPADLHRAAPVSRLFRADRPFPAAQPGRRGGPALPDHRGRRGNGGAHDDQGPRKGAPQPPGHQGRILLQLGAAASRWNSSSRSVRPTRRWRALQICTATARGTSWRRTCAGRFPASSPAT